MEHHEKRIAIQFFGHLRTFRQTYQSFKKNVIDTHKRNGYEIDVFMHTWDELEIARGNWSCTNTAIRGKKISESDLEFIKLYYNPTQILVEKMTVEHGAKVSMESVDKLRRSYEKTEVTYDWIIMIRPDIFFYKPFLIDTYLKPYFETGPLIHLGLPADAIFTAHNSFGWMDVADPRYVCESDLLWFARPEVILNRFHNCICETFEKNKMVLLNYILGRDFDIMRTEGTQRRHPLIRLLIDNFAPLPLRQLRRKIRGGI